MKKLILIRHAERPAIAKNDVGNDVLLTERGKEQTRYFAQQLKLPIISICSSPIMRCLQTAEILADESGFSAKDITQSHLLGDPGFIIEDGNRAWKHWQNKGHEAVNQHLLNGSEHWDGFAYLDDAVNRFTEQIIRTLDESEAGLHIWVTHDTILGAYASRVLDKSLSLSEWPEFLGYLQVEDNSTGRYTFTYQQSPKY